MNKVLVFVYVPLIEQEYELFIPINRKIGMIKKLICKAIIELSDNNYRVNKSVKLSNKSRYVISSDCIPNYNYISTLEETICDDGFIITTCQESILLINVGENVYFLASCLVNDHKLYSMLYTFMENHQCVIDVSKFKHLFPMKILVPLFEKENQMYRTVKKSLLSPLFGEAGSAFYVWLICFLPSSVA